MTDRGLIELAAKAAGYIVVGPADEMVVDPEHKSGGLVIKNDRGGDSLWHPLKDDADAFRLAVKLGLRLEWCRIDSYTVEHQGYGVVVQWPPGGIKNRTISEVSEFQADPYAATRRAITRAAAEIGKAMEAGK